jgi:metallophosphoesterase (TIGR00282 family)
LKILAIGDVTSPKGVEHLKNSLWKVRRDLGADFCIVNGENASFLTGISPELAEELLRAGADAITGGNHTMQNKQAYTYLEDTKEMIRPINFGDTAPGRGYSILDANGYRVLVMNAMGCVHIEPNLDAPYSFIERALAREASRYDIAVLDIHAEATGEKYAVAMHFDGKFSAIFGTHTHVPTADEQILPHGTGYITDVGMCGPYDSILGVKKEDVVKRTWTSQPTPFNVQEEGESIFSAVLLTFNDQTYECERIQTIYEILD